MGAKRCGNTYARVLQAQPVGGFEFTIRGSGIKDDVAALRGVTAWFASVGFVCQSRTRAVELNEASGSANKESRKVKRHFLRSLRDFRSICGYIPTCTISAC